MNPIALNLTGLYDTVGQESPVNLADFTHLFRAEFGEARDSGFSGSLWSGDSYRYEVLRGNPDAGTANYLVKRTDGGGTYYYLARHNHRELWESITALPEPRRWDFCHLICHVATGAKAKGYATGTRDTMTAFAEGRLVKRKVRGQAAYKVEVKPKVETAAFAA